MRENMYLFFRSCLIALNLIIHSCIYFVAKDNISLFLWLRSIPWDIYVYHIFCIHSSVDEHLDWFNVLAIVNWAAMNIRIQITLSYAGFILLQEILSVNLHCLPQCRTSLHPHQQWIRVSSPTHLRQHLLSSDFQMIAILIRMWFIWHYGYFHVTKCWWFWAFFFSVHPLAIRNSFFKKCLCPLPIC